MRSRRRGGQKCPTGLRAGVSKGRSSVEVPVMGMERSAERKDGKDTMTAAKAMKPKGGAEVCLVREGSTPNTTLMQRVLTRENLQRAWEQVMENGQWSPSEKGVPQGGPLSPLLANIVLHDLDMELAKRGHKFVRYADDFLVLVKSERAGQRVMASLTRFLEKKLRLAVNPQKSKVAKLGECRFLGFTFRKKKIVWSEKSLARFKRRVKA